MFIDLLPIQLSGPPNAYRPFSVISNVSCPCITHCCGEESISESCCYTAPWVRVAFMEEDYPCKAESDLVAAP